MRTFVERVQTYDQVIEVRDLAYIHYGPRLKIGPSSAPGYAPPIPRWSSSINFRLISPTRIYTDPHGRVTYSPSCLSGTSKICPSPLCLPLISHPYLSFSACADWRTVPARLKPFPSLCVCATGTCPRGESVPRAEPWRVTVATDHELELVDTFKPERVESWNSLSCVLFPGYYII